MRKMDSQLGNTLGTGFYNDALDEAVAVHGKPEILNTDPEANLPLIFWRPGEGHGDRPEYGWEMPGSG